MLFRNLLSIFLTFNASFCLAKPNTEFRLYLSGGAAGAETFTPFLKDAGHGHIVVLKAYKGYDGWYEKNLPKFGKLKSVTTLNFVDDSKSNNKEIYSQIINADGLFIAGGNQFKYHSRWKGTLVEKAINQQLLMNTPVGGSSAGLAILGQYYYSAAPHGDPIKKDFLQSPLLDGIITDTHFAERKRQKRLLGFVNHIYEKYKDSVYGIGVDESTVLIMDKSEKACVAGSGQVWFLKHEMYKTYNAGECL